MAPNGNTNPVRVVHVTTVDMSLRFLLRDQLAYLQEAGYEVSAISSNGPWVEEIRSGGLPVHVVPMRRAVTPLADLVTLLRLFIYFRRGRFAVVHTHTPKANLLGQVAARLARVPVRVVTLHGLRINDTMPAWQRRLYMYFDTVACGCAHWVFCQARGDTETAVRTGICPQAKIRHLGNGVDVARFRRQDHLAAARALRTALGIDSEAPVVGIVGRITVEKGYREFVNAAAIIRKSVPNAFFVAIGPDDSDLRRQLEREVTQLGLEGCFRWLGLQLDMPQLYAMMSVLTLPSYREGLPRVLMEAAASSLPVVASDIPAAGEIVDPGRTGLLVPARDSRTLASAIVQLLRDPEGAAAMGAEGRSKAEREFDQVPVFERVRNAYVELLSGRGNVASDSCTVRAGGATLPSGGGIPAGSLVRRRPARPHREHSAFLTSFVKRALDITTSLLGLLVLSPLFALIAACIKLTSKGPIFFRQQRTGLRARPFSIAKFRTMADLRDEKGNLLPDNLRVTRVGRFLRRTSLDELPEFFNVLRGEMSLVGPRPLLMKYLGRYSPEQARRHEVKPGITGWAQANGRNLISWEQKFALDTWYVDHQSFWLDLRIMALTVLKVLCREGIAPAGRETVSEFGE